MVHGKWYSRLTNCNEDKANNMKIDSDHELNNYFIAIDGDDIGPQLRDFIINNNTKGAAKYSRELKKYFKVLENWLLRAGAKIIFRGGDSILAYQSFDSLENISKNIPNGVCEISVGFGKSAEFAYLALQLAKARGKGRVVELRNTEAVTLRVISESHLSRRQSWN